MIYRQVKRPKKDTPAEEKKPKAPAKKKTKKEKKADDE